MLRPIVQSGDPVLRQRAREIEAGEFGSPSLLALIDDMRETMRAAPGVGLAAPQIGESIRLVVIEDAPAGAATWPPELERANVPFHALVNPVLTITDTEPRSFFEGCLSLSGLRAVTPRARAVRVEAFDPLGQPVVIDASGWYARILQHEIDHLEGMLYVDRMLTRTLMTGEQLARHWARASMSEVCDALGARRPG